MTNVIKWLIQKNDSVTVDSIPWVIVFTLYWIASLILSLTVVIAANNLIEQYGVIPSQFSVLLFNISGFLQIIFAIYIALYSVFIAFDYWSEN